MSIYIEAPRAFCVERTIANMGVTSEVANATIERTDKFRQTITSTIHTETTGPIR